MLLPRPFLAQAVHLSILSHFSFHWVLLGPQSSLHSLLSSPNCCLITQGVVVFQIWGKWNAEHNYLYISSSVPRPAPRTCQHFQAFCNPPSNFLPSHSIILSNSHSQRHPPGSCLRASLPSCPSDLISPCPEPAVLHVQAQRPLSCDGALPGRVPLSPLQALELPEDKHQLWFQPPPAPPCWCSVGPVCVCWSRAWP